ncbi:hypothetical protein [Rhodococcus sp. NPDC055024]
MSGIRSQATPARDELAAAIKGYGKSFLGECEEVDLAKIEHSFDCMADGLADYLTEDAGWSRPRTVNSAELDALPVESVIAIDGYPKAYFKQTSTLCWAPVGRTTPSCLTSRGLLGGDLPSRTARVLFTPGEAG